MLEAARAFRAQKAGEDVTEEMKRELRGMVPPPHFIYKSPIAPVFTVLNENKAPNLYEDDFFVLYLNTFLPFRELYPGKEDRAGMAFVHMLACPKERIYNAVALEPTDGLLLEHMRKTVVTLVNNNLFRIKVMNTLMQQFSEVSASNKTKMTFETCTTMWLNHTNGNHIGFYFHKHPYNSVGHLHMHCVTNNMRTNYVHDDHNTPLEDIFDELKKKLCV
jgi:Scavenger mRNA decapping enzyme C-term binding